MTSERRGIEWGIRVTCDRRALAAAMEAALPEASLRVPGGLSPEQASLWEKRRAVDSIQRVEERLDEVVDAILDNLEACAAQTRERPVLRGERGATLLHLALLVDEGADAALGGVVAALAVRHRVEGFSFDVAGPWSPSSFLEDDVEASLVRDVSRPVLHERRARRVGG